MCTRVAWLVDMLYMFDTVIYCYMHSYARILLLVLLGGRCFANNLARKVKTASIGGL